MSLESEWTRQKADKQSKVDELITIGLSLETAKQLAGWNATLDFETYEDMQEANKAEVERMHKSKSKKRG